MGSNPSNPSNPSHQTWPSASLCRCSHWTPEGNCRYTGSFVPFSLQTHKNVVYDFQNYTTYVCFKSELFEHDPQQYDFQNYNSYVCFKNELLHPQKEKSRTCSNFEVFDHDPQPNPPKPTHPTQPTN